MNNGLKYYLILLLTVLIACSNDLTDSTENYANYINPFIGTAFRGNTYPGATVPFGMVQLSPDTYITGDRASGYRYDAKSIIGFSHTHLSGTGLGEMLDLLIMPMTGDIKLDPGKELNPDNGYRSRFTHENESASPGYYSVHLDDYNIKVELTATNRVGFHRYVIPENKKVHIILDLAHRFLNSGLPSEIIESNFQIVNNSLITGMRRITGLAPNRYVYFAAEFSKPFQSYGISADNQVLQKINKASGRNLKCSVTYDAGSGEQIQIKVGISAVSIDGAIKNLKDEIPHWNFEDVKKKAENEWNKALGKIEAQFIDDDSKTTFYTALYHTMLAPVHYSDVDSSYRGSDYLIHQADDYQNYHIFPLWETFRAAHPLFTIIQQERMDDILKSIAKIAEESGSAPVWHLAANETNSKPGSHAIPVIVDAYLKGYRNFNVNNIYSIIKRNELIEINTEAFKRSDLRMLDQMDPSVSKTLFRKHGYVPYDISNHSVSKTLEYAYDDWCLAQMAKLLDQEDDYAKFVESSQSYKNVYDVETGLMRGKSSLGVWREPFNRFDIVNHSQQGDYSGASALQNSWFVPHDIPGLIELLGGKENTIEKLDFLFNPKNQSRVLSEDVAGFVGLYSQGNETDHHVAYIYTYAGQPWKTQAILRWILTRLYTNSTPGLTGNDDGGQLSAWYIFNTLGFYPVNPCGGIYVIGSPWVKNARINLPGGKQFEILTQNQSMDNKYIQSVSLNGEPYDKLWITHEDIVNGGTIVFIMGEKPNKNWGMSNLAIPSIYKERE